MESTRNLKRFNSRVIGIAALSLLVLALLVAAASGVSFSFGSTASQPMPTPPGDLNTTQRVTYKSLDDLPNTQSFPQPAQLTQYNKATQSLIDEVQLINRETGAGTTPTQIQQMAELQSKVDLNYVSARELATSLSKIYPNVDVLSVFNRLPAQIISVFENPPYMLVPYFGG
jgi:hypothetical protein